VENGMGVEKMNRFVLGLGCVAGLVLPSIASAALSLQIGPQASPATPDVTITKGAAPSGQQFMDLIFTDDGAENEGLFAYDLVLNVVRPAGRTGGISLAGADRPPTDFVLSDDPNKSTFSVANNTPDNLLINISSNNDLFDITSGKKAARVFYTVDPNIDLGDYSIVFDTANTVFGSGDPNRPDPAIPVGLVDAGFIQVVPEPASLSLLGFAGLLVLRRRRAA
jgi:hypothetical protein